MSLPSAKQTLRGTASTQANLFHDLREICNLLAVTARIRSSQTELLRGHSTSRFAARGQSSGAPAHPPVRNVSPDAYRDQRDPCTELEPDLWPLRSSQSRPRRVFRRGCLFVRIDGQDGLVHLAHHACGNRRHRICLASSLASAACACAMTFSQLPRWRQASSFLVLFAPATPSVGTRHFPDSGGQLQRRLPPSSSSAAQSPPPAASVSTRRCGHDSRNLQRSHRQGLFVAKNGYEFALALLAIACGPGLLGSGPRLGRPGAQPPQGLRKNGRRITRRRPARPGEAASGSLSR